MPPVQQELLELQEPLELLDRLVHPAFPDLLVLMEL